MMEKTEGIDEQESEILQALLKNGKLGIRQLLENTDPMGQRALYKNLKVLKQKNLVEVSSDGYRKFHYLTAQGFEVAKRIVALKTIEREARELLYQDDVNKKLHAVEMIFKELFEIFWSQKWDLEATKKWKMLGDVIELTAKNYLNRDVPQKEKLLQDKSVRYHDAYFALISMRAQDLLQDALLAKKLGHHLTENHMDILVRTVTVDSYNELQQHNSDWFRKYSIEQQDDQFFKEEEERKGLLSERGIAPINYDRKIRFSRNNINY